MESRQINAVEVHRGSGNVFADLGLADADKLKIKTRDQRGIRARTRDQGLEFPTPSKRPSRLKIQDLTQYCSFS